MSLQAEQTQNRTLAPTSQSRHKSQEKSLILEVCRCGLKHLTFLIRVIQLMLMMAFDSDLSEFDEDDPLAGLLSDEDDDLDPKPKPKKSSTAKKTSSSGISSQGVLATAIIFSI